MTDDVVIALDVGGTVVKCALVGPDGAVRHTERHPTGRDRGADAVVATILDIADGLATTAGGLGLRPRAVGLVVPGVVDEATGTAVWAANLGFRDVPLKAMSYGEVEDAAKGTVRQTVKLSVGISDVKARELNKFIKDLKIKSASSQAQGDQVRVQSKKRDDLQTVIAALKAEDFGIPLQFKNFRD